MHEFDNACARLPPRRQRVLLIYSAVALLAATLGVGATLAVRLFGIGPDASRPAPVITMNDEAVYGKVEPGVVDVGEPSLRVDRHSNGITARRERRSRDRYEGTALLDLVAGDVRAAVGVAEVHHIDQTDDVRWTGALRNARQHSRTSDIRRGAL